SIFTPACASVCCIDSAIPVTGWLFRTSMVIEKPSGTPAKAALLERDAAKRAAIYQEIQKKYLANSPFVFIFQKTEVAGYRKSVKDF
ncbi:hypothetical protein AB9E28_34910, partial [Rhizobium leguminosarum]|uniref:hypothetical protein n=1 Tax=Rhizobium leguminosarum TaxID=384 RepID=UPI003F9E380F